MEQAQTSQYSDGELLYHPSWLDNPRGFIDLRSKEAEEFNEILNAFLPQEVIHWDCQEDNGWSFEFKDIVLNVTSSALDPVQVFANTWAMHRRYIDPLRRNLRQILSWPLESRHDMFGFAMILLRMAEEVAMHIQDWKAGREPPQDEQKIQGWNVREITDFNCIYDNAKGLDLDTVDESGDEILGTSIKAICDDIPEEYRILHVEPVFREDLVVRFRRRQQKMHDQLMELSYAKLRQCVSTQQIRKDSALDNRKDLATEICKPRVTFHGTNRRNVSSIVRHGFVKPGDKAGGNTIKIACGASFGVGIYSSPYPTYSLTYADITSGSKQKTKPEDLPGLRLIVCAVLMGRTLGVTRDETRRTTEIADTSAHSHVSPNQCEYVVFDNAQIIPCYVIHLDLGAEAAKKALQHAPDDPYNWKPPKLHPKLQARELFPAEKEEIKQATKAAAAKWFPYGFGPAKGTAFVIEEIGEADDDEEDYGEYQGQRQEVGNEFRDWEDNMDGTSWFDEYQKVRMTYKGQRNIGLDDD